MKKQLTAEQMKAIRSFARENGRTWKTSLRSAWETGNYAPYENAPALQTIRNTFGPSWLVAFNLKEVCTVCEGTGEPYSAASRAIFGVCLGCDGTGKEKSNKPAAKTQKAIKKYGLDVCLKAFEYHEQGFGAAGILHGCMSDFKTVNQVDAAVNAGRDYKANAQ